MSILGKNNPYGFSIPLLKTNEKKSNEKNNYEIKVAIIGNCSVGKSSLVQRVTSGSFNDKSSSTIGAAFCVFNHKTENNNYKYQMWDTAGQERFKSLVPVYLRGSNIVLIVFDLTSRSSFEDSIGHWHQEVLNNSPDAVKILIGSKLDLKKNREVNKSEAIRFAKNNRMEYIECSAKTGENITEFKNLIIKTGIEEIKAYDIDTVLSNTTQKDNIVRLTDEDPTLLDKFRSNCVNGYQCYGL